MRKILALFRALLAMVPTIGMAGPVEPFNAAKFDALTA